MKHLEHVQICTNCKGEGVTDSCEWKTHGLQHQSTTICQTCKGSGRVLKTVVINVEPYTEGMPIINRMFERLHPVSINANEVIGCLHNQKVENRSNQ